MKRFAVAALFGLCSIAWGQPVLRATNPVVNGGSYAAGIAQGSIFVVFGSNLAGDAVVLNQALPLQTTLGGVSIRFTPVSGGSAVDALMVYTTRNQIAGLLPSSAAAGDYNVAVTYSGRTSPTARVSVVARNFGIVSADGSGSGQAQIQNYRSGTEWDLNRVAKGRLGPYTTSPASPGQVLVIWGTGLGADTSSDLNGGVTQNYTSATRVLIGGREITPAYAGRSSGLPGTDQINITLPADVTQGCSVPLQLRVGDTYSNTVYLAIAESGRNSCTHAYLTEAALIRLAEGGRVTSGQFILSKQSMNISVMGFDLSTVTESVSGSISRYNVGNLVSSSDASGLPFGTCRVYRQTGNQATLLAPAAVENLDAGAQLTLSGPGVTGTLGAVPRQADKSYTKALSQPGAGGLPGGLPGGIPGLPGGGGTAAAVIQQGTYNLSAPGGADVGAFTATAAVPTPLQWTNQAAISTIARSSGVTLNWSGAGSGSVVSIFGMSGTQVGGSAQDPILDAAIFICLPNQGATSFNVPASILSQLPATVGDTSIGMLGITQTGDGNNGKFTAPLTAGGSTDYGLFTFSVNVLKTVTYR